MAGEEHAIETEVVRRAKKLGWTGYKASWVGQRGAPDRLFVRDGIHVWIEFKRPGKEPTEQQWRMIDRLRAAGMNVEWCDSVGSAMGTLESYRQRTAT